MPENQLVTLATLTNMAAGAYVLVAKANIGATVPQVLRSQCNLVAGNNTDTTVKTSPLLAIPGGTAQTVHNLQTTVTFVGTAPGSARIECSTSAGSWTAQNISIIAINVGSATREAVSG